MENAVTIFACVIISYFSILCHEFGHMVVAILAKMSAKEIVLGVGPEIASFTFLGIKYHWRLLPIKGSILLRGGSNWFLQYPIGYQLFYYSGGILMNLFISLVSYKLLIIFSCSEIADTICSFPPIIDHPLDLCLTSKIMLYVNINMAIVSLCIPYVHFDGGKMLFLLIDKYLPRYIPHYLYICMTLTVSLVLLIIASFVKLYIR